VINLNFLEHVHLGNGDIGYIFFEEKCRLWLNVIVQLIHVKLVYTSSWLSHFSQLLLYNLPMTELFNFNGSEFVKNATECILFVV
jgi:hypothetical protein